MFKQYLTSSDPCKTSDTSKTFWSKVLQSNCCSRRVFLGKLTCGDSAYDRGGGGCGGGCGYSRVKA